MEKPPTNTDSIPISIQIRNQWKRIQEAFRRQKLQILKNVNFPMSSCLLIVHCDYLFLYLNVLYTHNMVTAQQLLWLLIFRCISSPYAHYGHGPVPIWLIIYTYKNIYIYFCMTIFSLHKNSITAWQPLWLLIYAWISSPSTQDGCGLWLLILHVYSFYTHNMVTAQQPLLLLIYRCITSPYTQYGHGPAPNVINQLWLNISSMRTKENQVYMNIISTQKNIVTAWQPLGILIYTWL